MANVKYLDSLAPFQHAKNHTIDMGFAAVQQMPKALVLRGDRASVRKFFKAEDRSFETLVPTAGGVRLSGVDVLV